MDRVEVITSVEPVVALERGVQPDLALDDDALAYRAPAEWRVVRWRGAAIFQADAAALEVLPAEDRLRRRWITASPRYLPRTSPAEHVCVFTSAEIAALERLPDERIRLVVV